MSEENNSSVVRETHEPNVDVMFMSDKHGTRVTLRVKGQEEALTDSSISDLIRDLLTAQHHIAIARNVSQPTKCWISKFFGRGG